MQLQMSRYGWYNPNCSSCKDHPVDLLMKTVGLGSTRHQQLDPLQILWREKSLVANFDFGFASNLLFRSVWVQNLRT